MPLSHRDYTVACICPMGVELAPVKALLDQTHPSLPTQRDQNSYTLGVIGGHNIVIAVLPEIGTNSTKRNTHFPGSSIFQQTIEPPRDGSSPKLPTSKWAGRRLRHGLESSHRIGYMTGKENLCFSSHIKGRLRPKNCASRERRDFPRKGLGIDLSDPGVTRGRTRQANCTHRHIRLLRAELRKCIENCMATRPM
jgi:hypothetical protein